LEPVQKQSNDWARAVVLRVVAMKKLAQPPLRIRQMSNNNHRDRNNYEDGNRRCQEVWHRRVTSSRASLAVPRNLGKVHEFSASLPVGWLYASLPRALSSAAIHTTIKA